MDGKRASPAVRQRPRPKPAEEVSAAFRLRFVEAQYAWISMIMRYLVCWRGRLSDLAEFLILGAMVQATLADTLRAYRQCADAVSPGVDLLEPSALNASSISAMIGIPRETVRRKLARLRKSGLVERCEDGTWRLARAPGGEVKLRERHRDMNQAMIAGLAQLFAELRDLAMDHDAAATTLRRS
jgi:DNA-binding transcriptional ArsR family regulator